MHYTELTYANSQYPDIFREIASPPKTLYVRGELNAGRPLVAIVGTRRPTAYGEQVTYSLAHGLAMEGIGIVSGLALGIDAIAHQAAVDAGGYTIAVLGAGLDSDYPTSNKGLARKIIRTGGAIITEHPLGTPPLKQHFPARNRLISGLSRGVIVTEAARKSGSLHTINFALEQGRSVMAVPGNITSWASAGPNNLLREGAIAVTSAKEVLKELNITPGETPAAAFAPGSPSEAAVLKLLAKGSATSQELIEQSQLSAAEFAHVISLLEINGVVRNLGAGVWVRR